VETIMRLNKRSLAAGAGLLVTVALVTGVLEAQRTVRASRRGTVAHGEEGSVAVGRRGVAVAGEEGAAAAGRRGAVRVGDEGAAAVGRRGAVVAGEEGAAAVGRYGGVVVGERYESHEAWQTAARVTAGVATTIAIGTMLSRPPTSSTTIVVGGTSYMYSDGAYYAKVISSGSVAYQVVPAPAGAIITTLPAGCKSVHAGGVSYSQCGPTYYQRVSNGYQVVVLR
jgi:hypothetical protein